VTCLNCPNRPSTSRGFRQSLESSIGLTAKRSRVFNHLGPPSPFDRMWGAEPQCQGRYKIFIQYTTQCAPALGKYTHNPWHSCLPATAQVYWIRYWILGRFCPNNLVYETVHRHRRAGSCRKRSGTCYGASLVLSPGMDATEVGLRVGLSRDFGQKSDSAIEKPAKIFMKFWAATAVVSYAKRRMLSAFEFGRSTCR
jgi:hypothetical protein